MKSFFVTLTAIALGVGGLSGWFSHSLETPITIQLLPHGVAVGLKAKV